MTGRPWRPVFSFARRPWQTCADLDECASSTRRTRFAALQTAIRARVEANINAGYFYAADVYIDMFEQARGEQTVSRELRTLLAQRRALNVSAPALGAISAIAS